MAHLNSGITISRKEGSQADELFTPEYAVKPILKYLKPHSLILCPFDKKDSAYVKVLTDAGHNVLYSHKDHNGDFFKTQEWVIKKVDYIISNPPYSIKDKILSHLYEWGKPFAMLMPLTTLEGMKRNIMYRNKGVQLLVLDKRVGFLNDNDGVQHTSNHFNTSYFCYKILPENLIFHELVKK